MKKGYVSLFFAVTIVLIMTSSTMPVCANNILNPGFESGDLLPWFHDRGTGPELPNVTNAVSHSGQYSATWLGNQELRQNFAPVSTNLITEISFWSSQPELDHVLLQVSFFYSDGTNSAFVPSIPGTGWLESDVTSHLTLNKELVGFSVFGYSGAGSAEDRTYFDDVTLATTEVVPEPTTMLLLGSGLIGLAGYGRKKFFKK